MSDDSLLLVGCGKMGSALLGQWLVARSWNGRVHVVDHAPTVTDPMKASSGISYYETLDAVKNVNPKAIFLAVKPQMMTETLPIYKSRFGDTPLYISIAAGLTLSFYEQYLGSAARIIRVMPNTPVIVGMGISALIANKQTRPDDKHFVDALFTSVGETLWLDTESLMDPVTAISGSGPAYVFYFMECLIAAAIDAGFDEETAKKLVVHTVHGASQLAISSKEPLIDLRRNVTSPGGTTEAALAHLMNPSGMLRLIQEAVQLAIHRATQLSVAAKKQQG
ncbi:MAG: pyrroline-5-carboxylate reductase [Rickettsiales bacterium]